MARDHTCINHPSRPAVARCNQCNSPICPDCAQQYPAGTFCSKLHAERYTAFNARGQKAKPSRWGLWFWLLVLLLTLAVIGVFAAYYAGYIEWPTTARTVETDEQYLISR